MKVLVVGANGQIGKFLVGLLSESRKHSVRAMIRKEEQKEYFENIGVETVVQSLEDSVEQLAQASKGCDAVVFTAGSGGSTGSDQTLLIDLDGAAKTVEAAEQSGIDRFIMVSSLQAHNRENWYYKMKPYYAAKHYADKVLMNSTLNYTILRPGALLNDEGTGKVKIAQDITKGAIPRQDVARTIFFTLNAENTFKRSFDLVSGETAISDAIKAF